MLSVVVAGLRAVAGRLLLALVFGGVAFLLAQQVAGNVVERFGSPPPMTPVPAGAAVPAS